MFGGDRGRGERSLELLPPPRENEPCFETSCGGDGGSMGAEDGEPWREDGDERYWWRRGGEWKRLPVLW